jgi:hypothetical protein
MTHDYKSHVGPVILGTAQAAMEKYIANVDGAVKGMCSMVGLM